MLLLITWNIAAGSFFLAALAKFITPNEYNYYSSFTVYPILALLLIFVNQYSNRYLFIFYMTVPNF